MDSIEQKPFNREFPEEINSDWRAEGFVSLCSVLQGFRGIDTAGMVASVEDVLAKTALVPVFSQFISWGINIKLVIISTFGV